MVEAVTSSREERRHALDEAGEGDPAGLEVLGQRALHDLRAQPTEPFERRLEGLDDDRLCAHTFAEAFGDDAETHAAEIPRGRIDGRDGTRGRRDHVEHACRRLDAACHGPRVIEGAVDPDDARVGDEPVGGLEPDDAAPGRRHADRAPWSVPRPASTPSYQSAAAEPPDEPPAVRSRSNGHSVAP